MAKSRELESQVIPQCGFDPIADVLLSAATTSTDLNTAIYFGDNMLQEATRLRKLFEQNPTPTRQDIYSGWTCSVRPWDILETGERRLRVPLLSRFTPSAVQGKFISPSYVHKMLEGMGVLGADESFQSLEKHGSKSYRVVGSRTVHDVPYFKSEREGVFQAGDLLTNFDGVVLNIASRSPYENPDISLVMPKSTYIRLAATT